MGGYAFTLDGCFDVAHAKNRWGWKSRYKAYGSNANDVRNSHTFAKV